jgi:hypothetical protein
MSYPANEYAAFLNHRDPLLELLEMIPADQGEFKIYPEGESLREMVDQFFECDAQVFTELTGEEPETGESPDLPTATVRLRGTSKRLPN